jgi:hypothetical protein
LGVGVAPQLESGQSASACLARLDGRV